NSISGIPSWIELTPTPPAARYYHSAVYDPVSNQMTIFGGLISTFSPDANVVTLSEANGLTALATLESIAISPPNPTIALGATQQFVATGTYTNGSTQDLTSAASWGSSSTAVATIAAGGLATGQGAGTATITATSGLITASATLTVGQAALVSLVVTPALPS